MNAKGTAIRRHVIQALSALALLALLVWGFRPVPRLVDVEPVVRGPLAVTLEAEGRTRVVERYRISAPVDGQLRRLELEVGDSVQAGQVIAILDAQVSPVLDRRSQERAGARLASAESELAATRAAVTAAEASASLARVELERIERLAKPGMVSRTQLDQARAESLGREAELDAARFRVQSAERDRLAAQAELKYAGELAPGEQGRLELTAPVDGVVLKRESESARVVRAGDVILELGDPGALEIEVDVLSADAVRLAVGRRVWIERWGEPTPLEGRITRIEPVAFTKVSALGVEEQRVWVIVALTTRRAEWARLGDGYRVNARFVLWEAEDVLQVPTSSLFRHGEGWALFCAVDEHARLTPVELGHRGALQTELRGGLEIGTAVIVHPDRELADGTRVQISD
ncbi:efflux RND transporter periplasmic adaptor subunit [Allochromatium palmeri]|uniref:HlyD family efflux transporter periplasmic adaptor subunit n=1 Tax=Allochromatium palmeri TaxID=231048 RepID=A0A6N8EBP7_9GAMM|nr:HlyD family efflux transporter periplasmic adaptor subunit [Allochromatium palmeri]MTW21011.1 HlyD family efflux transporter periplasmic adaptor subunit [Allochromatium palmeri]